MDREVRRSVQVEVHPGDGRGGEVLLLAEEPAPERPVVAVVLVDVVDRLEQHTARAARGVVHALPLAGIEDPDHQPDHRPRRVELAGLFVGEVGELLDQVFVGLPEDISLGRLVIQDDL